MSTAEPDRPKTRERILNAAAELVQAKGPAATGTLEILALADAPRGSLYYHFPGGKDQLVGEAVSLVAAIVEGRLADALANRAVSLPERVENFLTAVADRLVIEDFKLGCGIAATVLDTAASSAALRAATEAAFASWTSLLVAQFSAEGIDPDEAASLADVIVAGLEGGWMLSRSRRDPTPIRHVATSMRTLVAAALAGRPSDGSGMDLQRNRNAG